MGLSMMLPPGVKPKAKGKRNDKNRLAYGISQLSPPAAGT